MTSMDSRVNGGGRRNTRLTPDAVRRAQFTRSPLGRRGYLESDVDRFRGRLADELAHADAEKAELRAEIERLREYFRSQRIDPSRAGNEVVVSVPDPALPTVQAVNMMSLAQQAADQHIAQAEAYARQLVGDARRQQEEILLAAHHRAEQAAQEATRAYNESTSAEDRSVEHADLEAQIAYMRTFADVTQVQMRSILDALAQQLDRLSRYGSQRTVGAPTGPPDPGTALSLHAPLPDRSIP
jgi:cell division initiation protein